MSEKQFTIHKESKYKEEWCNYPFCIKEDGEVVLETIPLGIAEKVRDKLNEQQAEIEELGISIKLFEDDIATKDKKIDEQQVIISQLQDLCGQSDGENAKLRIENKKLKEENEKLRLELETHKHPLWSTREAERKLSEVTDNLANEVKKNGLLNEEINQLQIENMRLKKGGEWCMTNKRFVHIERKGADYILDSPNWDLDFIEMLGDSLEPKELVGLLNKLYEENEQLRENLHNCRLNKNIIREKLKLWQDVHKEYDIYSIKDFEESFELDAKINKEKRI